MLFVFLGFDAACRAAAGVIGTEVPCATMGLQWQRVQVVCLWLKALHPGLRLANGESSARYI